MNTTPSAIQENDISLQADELMSGINNTKLIKLLGVSTVAHVAIILLLSVGNIIMCAKYGTINVTHAYALNTQEIKDAQLADKQRIIDEKDAALAAQDAEGAAKDAKPDKNDKEVPAELTETKEAPTEPDDEGIGLDDLGID
tara:strand:- start:547 stop:972 length:426 start_codon:yes stop_codon:yes gene_type:complete